MRYIFWFENSLNAEQLEKVEELLTELLGERGGEWTLIAGVAKPSLVELAD